MEKIMPKTEDILVGSLGKKIRIFDLSVEYIDRAQTNRDADNAKEALLDASDLSEDEISRLRKSEADALYMAIVRLTFGDDAGAEDSGDEKK